MDIKEMLLGGATAEDLLEEFQDQLSKAQAEIEAEKAEKEDIDDARWMLVDAIVNYMIATKTIEEDDLDDDDYDSIYNGIKLAEKNCDMMFKLF